MHAAAAAAAGRRLQPLPPPARLTPPPPRVCRPYKPDDAFQPVSAGQPKLDVSGAGLDGDQELWLLQLPLDVSVAWVPRSPEGRVAAAAEASHSCCASAVHCCRPSEQRPAP